MVIIGSDHGGFELKEKIKDFLKELGETFEDVGVFSSDSCDYPDIAKEVAIRVAENGYKGILICGTGIGMSIAANKIDGVRCALCHDAYTAEFARRHNNANILAFGGRTTGIEIAKQMVSIFLKTPFDGGRHERRINKISELEAL
ncbi:ribose 5-phosphate isomerase B [Hippea maritima]|uniref:Sugar-phosphate isomerase, RpiB/LacA/LacB family n=1 Tax=Hippea maritima (strain ATCC 700847 / DSM 10411 / MH2) TaxID=760142 RepID=F2LXF1_HIPMA|nr:ribose 5-phosphate isomerase B [Hippea maritima]AEA34265.1 sugar-phosphate isomerase, RpiB/LacA/LacB family [Hippea maritima DSM 10411]